MLSWRCAAVLTGTELSEKEVGKCSGGRLDRLSAGEERIHFIEPKSQSGSTRTRRPASSSARALVSLDAAIPSPATALVVTPLSR